MSRANQQNKTLVAQHLIEGQFPVLWYMVGETHLISYGAATEWYDDDVRAAEAFGYAVRHQAECDGRLDP